MNKQQRAYRALGNAANASMMAVKESMKNVGEAMVYRGSHRYPGTRFELQSTVLRVYNDNLWTLNLQYIETIMQGVILAVKICEEKFQIAFGGFDPGTDEFGMYPIKSGDTEHHRIGPDEAVLITGFRIKNGHGNLKLISMACSFANDKLGPFTPIDHEGTIVLLPVPAVIEPRSRFEIDKATFYDKNEDRTVENDGSYMEPVGYWFTTKAKMIERR